MGGSPRSACEADRPAAMIQESLEMQAKLAGW